MSGALILSKDQTIGKQFDIVQKTLRARRQTSIVPIVPMRHRLWLSFQTALMAGATLTFRAAAADTPETPSRGEAMLANYFRAETAKLSDACLSGGVRTEHHTSRSVGTSRDAGGWPGLLKHSASARYSSSGGNRRRTFAGETPPISSARLGFPSFRRARAPLERNSLRYRIDSPDLFQMRL